MKSTYTVATDSYHRGLLLQKLMRDHVGQGKAANRRELIRAVYGEEAAKDESYNSPWVRKLRKLVEELIAEGHPICQSASLGHWYAAGLRDGMSSVEESRSKAKTWLVNAGKLEENLRKKFTDQLELIP